MRDHIEHEMEIYYVLNTPGCPGCPIGELRRVYAKRNGQSCQGMNSKLPLHFHEIGVFGLALVSMHKVHNINCAIYAPLHSVTFPTSTLARWLGGGYPEGMQRLTLTNANRPNCPRFMDRHGVYMAG